jgi:hypothetical protein
MISPLDAALAVAALAAPFYALVCWQLERFSDPAHLRAHGVAVVHPGMVERRGRIIGRYRSSEIHAELVFRGMVYRFDRIEPPGYRNLVGARELYLEPGLVYVTD